VQVIEEKPMQTGQVTVSKAADMSAGLASEGKIALYGVYFDTGKAEVLAPSKPQLEEMAKFLQTDRGANVFVVGHTDNQGSLDANLALSQRRAEAVVKTLIADFKIDAKRLVAKGVANFSPVTSNAAEAGRAKNRRVELVGQ
jgi:OmpA-OmpF porin, OOP family